MLYRYIREQGAPSFSAMAGLARASGIRLEWLATGEDAQEEGKALSDAGGGNLADEYALIPRYDIHVSAGHGSAVYEENEVQRMAFRRDWLRREGFAPDQLALVTTKGDSMEPTIGDGDLVLVDTSRNEVRDDSIYVLQVDGDVFAKRLQRDWEGGVWVRSDNPQYQDQHITAESYRQLKIVGRVVWIGRRV